MWFYERCDLMKKHNIQTWFHILTYFPVLEVIRKGHNTHFIHHVEAASSVKVENGVKGPRVPVKEVFIVHQGIGIAEFHDCIVSGAIFGQVTQP